MQVIKNEQTMYVRWHYKNRQLEKMISKAGMTFEDVKDMSKKELADKLGVNNLPKPEITSCLVCDEENEIISVADVKWCPKYPWSREVAREASLTKVLRKIYPNEGPGEHKEMRRAFWNAYFSRVAPKKTNKELSEEIADLREKVRQLEEQINRGSISTEVYY